MGGFRRQSLRRQVGGNQIDEENALVANSPELTAPRLRGASQTPFAPGGRERFRLSTFGGLFNAGFIAYKMLNHKQLF